MFVDEYRMIFISNGKVIYAVKTQSGTIDSFSLIDIPNPVIQLDFKPSLVFIAVDCYGFVWNFSIENHRVKTLCIKKFFIKLLVS